MNLSKLKLAAFRQCPRRLWLDANPQALSAKPVAAPQALAAGRDVGTLARAKHPGGVLIGPADADAALDWRQLFADTSAALRAQPRRPIFEATCEHDGVTVRADVLVPRPRGWHLVEVKSSTKVKPHHLEDVAVQTWVLRNAGVDVRSVALRYIDNSFVYPGYEKYAGLFKDERIDEQIEPLLAEVPRWATDAQGVLRGREPDVTMGSQCMQPAPCPYQAHCGEHAPQGPEYPVSLLPGPAGKKLARRLSEQGYDDLRKVPLTRIDATFRRIADVTRNGKPYVNRGAARRELAAHGYPRYYFDFETIAFAVPIWRGTRPYENLPFQWSCHIERERGVFEHCAFLDVRGSDPSAACAEALLAALGGAGPVFVYHASFERRVLEDLARRYPRRSVSLNAVIARLVDMEPTVKAHYYHRDMLGSYSIKRVLPTIAPEMDYANLAEVQDGTAAQLAYLEAIASPTSAARRSTLEKRLSDYCRRDTWAMVVLAHFLEGRKPPTLPG